MVTYITPAILPHRLSNRYATDEAAIDRWTNEGGAVYCGRKPALVDEFYRAGGKSFDLFANGIGASDSHAAAQLP
jgi:hypothetical protein